MVVLGTGTLAVTACTQTHVTDNHKQTAAIVNPVTLGPGTTLPDNPPTLPSRR